MPKKLTAALNYNENKVKQGKAECIHAAGYLRDANEMNFYQKQEGFERLNCLNERATTKTIHVSLNFDPTENFNSDKLIAIASEYLQRIGFGDQPYLIYKHADAGHPHIHLVSTTIREDGSRIPTHNIGKNQSEIARKEIEEKFGLVKAENQRRLANQKVHPVNIEKAIYGNGETKRSITTVINAVIHTYKYSSLPEFNAILKQFNVVADRGNEEGRIYKSRGLVYRVLDANGNKVGVPVKASCINGKPTLDKLEKLFALHQPKKEHYRDELKIKVDNALRLQPQSLKELIALLQAKNIYTVLRNNIEGRVYGITFVDNITKTVFNGSELGKSYSAINLQIQILQNEKKTAIPNSPGVSEGPKREFTQTNKAAQSEQVHEIKKIDLKDALLSTEKQFEGIPFQLLKRKRKRKRRPPGL